MGNKVTAIILAAGNGARMKLPVTKQRLKIDGETVLRRAVRAFSECDKIDSVIVVTRADEIDFAKAELSGLNKITKIVIGGKTRADSAKIGFSYVDVDTKFVAIHDAARCLVTGKMIEAVISDAEKYGAATASAKVYDTVKTVDTDNNIVNTVDRSALVAVGTPQIFKRELYEKALIAVQDLSKFTDDNMLLENIGVMPHCTDTGRYNIKITTEEDLLYAKLILEEKINEF